jgi:hypothetical protein
VKKLLALLIVLAAFVGTVTLTGCGGETKKTGSTGGGSTGGEKKTTP